MKKLSITAKTTAEDQKAKEKEEFDAELEELMNDDFLLEFQKRRMKEMLEHSGVLKRFGNLISLNTADDFLKAIDSENQNVTIVIHIYDEKFCACKTMNSCLNQLAKEYQTVKFCKIISTVTGLSKNFKTTALPTLLVYKNGQVIGNFIRISDELGGDEFFMSDVESFLIENGFLLDKSFENTLLSTNEKNNDDDDD